MAPSGYLLPVSPAAHYSHPPPPARTRFPPAAADGPFRTHMQASPLPTVPPPVAPLPLTSSIQRWWPAGVTRLFRCC